MYLKDGFGIGIPEVHQAAHAHKRDIMQIASALDCAAWTDRWLEKYASNEHAMIIAEDTDRVKQLMKLAIRICRNPKLVKDWGLDHVPGLPLKRVIDTVHFAAKANSAALQLADLCAFTFGRGMKDKPVPTDVFAVLWNHIKWIASFKPDLKFPELSDLTEPAP